MATDGHVDSRVFLNWTQSNIIDFRNSDLTSTASLTYSSTLGVIFGIEIHGWGMAEVVKSQDTGLVRYA